MSIVFSRVIFNSVVGAVTKLSNEFLESNSVSIDNWAFKFYYKYTTAIIIACSVGTTARLVRQYLLQIDVKTWNPEKVMVSYNLL
jgi:hypothetical protein